MTGGRLERILVSGENFALPLSVWDNDVDYYLGTRVYLECENCEIDLEVNTPGLVQIRTFKKDEVTKTRFYDELTDPNNVLCDTRYVFTLNYTGETVTDVTVKDCDDWPYPAIGFDSSRVGNPVELPEWIDIRFGNDTMLRIRGADDDFILEMREL